MTASRPNEHPILFSGPMVRAILEGRKSQTRRVVKPQPFPRDWVPVLTKAGWRAWPRNEENTGAYWTIGGGYGRCPYGQPGDHLWVREAHAIVPATAYRASEGVAQTVNPHDTYWAAIYRAGFDRAGWFPWKPSIHMPRWASRITLRITEIRVQRVQEISEEDALAEGVEGGQIEFFTLWHQINAKPGRTWADNPWVWAINFEVAQEGVAP